MVSSGSFIDWSSNISLSKSLIGISKSGEQITLSEGQANNELSGDNIIAIEEEVRRRYAKNKPDVHRHVNFKKKKWSGLQGEQ